MQKVDRRRLILGGIVLMLAMIAWTLYLEYDKRQFIQSLSPNCHRHATTSQTVPPSV